MNTQAPTQTPFESRPSASGRTQVHMRYKPLEDLTQYAMDFARERPEVAALWCFGIGLIIGWRLKP